MLYDGEMGSLTYYLVSSRRLLFRLFLLSNGFLLPVFLRCLRIRWLPFFVFMCRAARTDLISETSTGSFFCLLSFLSLLTQQLVCLVPSGLVLLRFLCLILSCGAIETSLLSGLPSFLSFLTHLVCPCLGSPVSSFLGSGSPCAHPLAVACRRLPVTVLVFPSGAVAHRCEVRRSI